MSAIADFKKRCEAAKRAQSQAADSPENTQAPGNEALLLLAALLGCDVDQAIEKAREAVEQKARFIEFKIDFYTAEGQDQSAQATVTTDDQSNIASIIEHAAELEDSAANVSTAAETALDAADKVSDSADKVSTAASDLESAASSVDDSASSLAYTAEDLGDIKNELKDVAAELKKPSAAQESSHGAKAAAPKSSSKKSG